MKEFHTGIVTRIISNLYIVKCGEHYYKAFPRGKLKLDGDIYVGDHVEITKSFPYSSIDKVLPRSNLLMRPYVANVDIAIIVIAKEPNPDLLLVDKIIIDCRRKGIKPVICYNKSDIATRAEIDEILSSYTDNECIITSTKAHDCCDEIIQYIRGSVVCFAGQSAVGKTSILNTLLKLNLKTGEMSARINQGKNTTRHVEIFEAYGGMIVDTCGFSKLTLSDMQPNDLKYYYDEFILTANKCNFSACSHITEPGCAVKKAVEMGEIDKNRYSRYLTIYEELSELKRNGNG
ncbi:MAG: ribosome small subunit-dependent GTPase A [Christensenellaceae bacterium]|jgi:ribosome biogenesis GTPase|nr:ribosome small subunit-dependent GTPase A [Christensenellaceae bacterium]